MKQLVRKIVRHFGFEFVRCSNDPILKELISLYHALRMESDAALSWDDSLPQVAAHAKLRHLLQVHHIDLLIDVGANNGQFARLARRMGYEGEIVSFEPLLKHRLELEEGTRSDGRWTLIPKALGSTSEELDLHVYSDDTFSSLHSINDAGLARFSGLVEESHVERVTVCTLDSLWEQLSGGKTRRVMLKTDTQGHDLAVLSGAVAVLKDTFAVVTEAAVQPIYSGAPLYGEVAAWMGERGFVPSGLFPISHRPEDLALIEMDVFFTRPVSTV